MWVNELPIVAENEQCPKHCALNNPIHRPNRPIVDVGGGDEQHSDGGDVPNDVGERPPGIFDPAMRRNRRPDIGNSERRRRGGVEFIRRPLSDSFVLFVAVVNRLSLRERDTGKNGHCDLTNKWLRIRSNGDWRVRGYLYGEREDNVGVCIEREMYVYFSNLWRRGEVGLSLL